jgi:hypothetical protein
MKKTLITLLFAALLTGCVEQTNRSPLADDGWTRLFNGTDLSGWRVKCLPADQDRTFWEVNDGAIECDSMGKPDHQYVWLMSEAEYDNFQLRLKFQVFRSSNGNSGVQFRSRYDDSDDAPNGGWLNGPQVDIHPPAPFRNGLIYDETQGVKRWIHPSLKDWNIQPDQAPAAVRDTKLKYADNDPDAWNTMEIICDGMNIQTFVNGRLISDYDATGVLDDQNHKTHNVGTTGHLALQLHANDQLRIRFKDIQIQEINK